MIKVVRFNIYLCSALSLLLFPGCKTGEKKDKDKVTIIELHMEVNSDGAKDNAPMSIGRNSAFEVNADKDPFLDAADLVSAKLVDDLGGFAIELKYNWKGTTLLDSMTTSYRGKRIAVFCKWDKERWLAAPKITRRITDGVFRFTPDCTHEEAESIIKGLTNVIKKLKDSD
jgi:hypothetical protein